jgi:hypothetical protein
MKAMRLFIPAAVIGLLVGCSSSWEIRVGDEIPIDSCQLKLFYADEDEDGWGDRGVDGSWVVDCGADAESGYTASNGRDCDDTDGKIRGDVGSVCPQNLAVGPDDVYAGVVSGGSEFVAIIGYESQVGYVAAEANCVGWGGLVDDGTDTSTWVERGHLATFSKTQVAELKTLIVANLADDEEVEVFIGVQWNGTDSNDGEWEWSDGSQEPSLTSVFDWCGGEEPTAIDFTPHLNPDDEEGYDGEGESSSPSSAAAEELDRVRLAMRFVGGEWCLGVPTEAQIANYVCERSEPDPLNYVEVATQEQIDSAGLDDSAE